MGYFILKSRQRVKGPDGQEYDSFNHFCANSIYRGIKDGIDSVWFVCSGQLTVLKASEVVAIAPTTPPYDWK